ncbi:MAG: UDP-N-acetylmuramoyl-tripeptide--D-alanyl-D-alanine ligase [Bryobacteraceae bacterium]|nr:UDP-N-acetylmuramoyl-tripeptide--D-alanyl-D-alanine ligase [Bryobacteraceae bacterium]
MTKERYEYWVRQVALGSIVNRLLPLITVAAFLWRRLLYRTTFIAITGSLGKTTAKECLAAILTARGRTYRTFRNQNGPEGVALNLLRVRPWHRYAVLEVGIGEPGTMAKMARTVRPDVAVALNVKRTHTTAFRDLDHHAAEKALLVRALRPGGLAILCRDDERVAAMGKDVNGAVRYFGEASGADYTARDVFDGWPERLRFVLQAPSGAQQMETQLVGRHWLNSALGALAAADSLGVKPDQAARLLAGVQPFAGRLQPVRVPGGAIVLRDDYNSSIESIEEAFRVLESASARRRWFVITDMSDSGGHRRQRLKYLAERAARAAEAVVFIGQHADYGKRRAIDAGIAPDNAHNFETLRQAAEFLRGALRPGDLVLLKGRTTDHAARIFWAQLGPVGCWREHCPKRMLCDICWELDITPEQARQAQVVVPERSRPELVRIQGA